MGGRECSVVSASKERILELVLSAGLLEKLIEFLRERGYPIEDPRRLIEVDLQLLERFAMEMRLLDEREELPELEGREELEVDALEPREVRPRTPTKRGSNKPTKSRWY